jgi:hypothetical protein
VVRNWVPQTTTDPFTKFVPVTVRVKLPTVMLAGETDITVGTGFSRVTLALALTVESAALVASTEIELGEGKIFGA